MKITPLQLFRIFLFFASCVSAGICAYFGIEKYYTLGNDSIHVVGSGASGGAIGMGIISGACLISLSITFIKDKQQ